MDSWLYFRYAGKRMLNPIGTILNIKIVMEKSFQSHKIEDEIEKALEDALLEVRTLDFEDTKIKTLTTKKIGNLISGKLKSKPKNQIFLIT
ncbi:MAG: isocitrate/isopropylmalate family dehydrogenase [Promethearchaeota archaeon]